MDREIKDLFMRCKELPYSSIGKQLTIEDAVDIWKNICQFIRTNLCENKTVILPGIGKFYLHKILVPFAHNPQRYLSSCSPVFEMSPQLATYFLMKQSTLHHPCKYPQVSVNPSLIACFSDHKRSMVIMCMREVLAWLQNNLARKQCVKLPLYGVGEIFFQNGESMMYFHRSLLREVERKGIITEKGDK